MDPPQQSRVRVGVLAPTPFHANWEAFKQYISEYAAHTHQQIRVKEVLNCALRNKRMLATKAAQSSAGRRLIPEEWKIFQRTYICTFGWSAKKSAPSDTGISHRPSRSTDCPFRFIVQVVERDGGWCLQVKSGVYHHNHVVHQPTFVPQGTVAHVPPALDSSSNTQDHARTNSTPQNPTREGAEAVLSPEIQSEDPTIQRTTFSLQLPPQPTVEIRPLIPPPILRPSPSISAIVAAPAKYHESWAAFQSYLRAYEEQTHQRIVVLETLTCAARNQRVRATKSFQRGAGTLIPEDWGVYQRTYICTLGQVPRRSSSGETSTRRQRVTNRTDTYAKCPFRFVVQVVQRSGGPELVQQSGDWCLEVKLGIFHHNHACAAERSDVVIFHAPPPPAVPILIQEPLRHAPPASAIVTGTPRPEESVDQVGVAGQPTPAYEQPRTPQIQASLGKRRRQESGHTVVSTALVGSHAYSNDVQPPATPLRDDGDDIDDDENADGAESYPASPNEEIPDGCVSVRPPSRHHASWDAFAKYLAEYSARTYQVIRVIEVMSCAQRNTRVRATKSFQLLGDHDGLIVPEHWEVYHRVYICTHSWRQRSRGQQKRQVKTRYTNCPFRFVLQLELHRGVWRLVVKLGRFYHNHTVDEATYKAYASSRGVKDPANLAAAKEMARAGAKRSLILKFLLEKGENVIKRDVDNFVARLRRQDAEEVAPT